MHSSEGIVGVANFAKFADFTKLTLTRRAKHRHDGIIGRLRLVSQTSDVLARRVDRSGD
jgi:hypothetical protein